MRSQLYNYKTLCCKALIHDVKSYGKKAEQHVDDRTQIGEDHDMEPMKVEMKNVQTVTKQLRSVHLVFATQPYR
jgi:hypothetical protein